MVCGTRVNDPTGLSITIIQQLPEDSGGMSEELETGRGFMVGSVTVVVFRVVVFSIGVGSVRMKLFPPWSGGRFSMGGPSLLEGTCRAEILGSLL